MRYLLDTHVFLWLDSEPERLSERVTSICADPENVLYLSYVSVWEVQIKSQLGKLKLPTPLPDMLNNQISTNQLNLLSVELQHIFGLSNLPPHHKDPFDRLLISQAIHEQLILLSDDNVIRRYPIPTVW